MPDIDLDTFLSTPKTVATVHRPEDLSLVSENKIAPETCDVLEFRLDSLRDHLDAAEAAMKATPFPCLVTARHPVEGGIGELPAADREALLRRFLPLAALVDIEARSLAEFQDLASQAKDSGVCVVASAHDFEGPMSGETLEQIAESSYHANADVIKVAMVLNSMLDLSSLMVLTATLTEAGGLVASMGMGPLGKVSRLTLAAAGSCLNYGYLSEPNAPGQWPAAELKRLVAEISY